MPFDICECILQFLSTSPLTKEQIMESIRENTVCTNTQYFENNYDAGFGVLPSPDTSLFFFLLLQAAFILLVPLPPILKPFL